MRLFRTAPEDIIPHIPPTKEEVRKGFQGQTETLGRAIYLFFASSGLRKNEVLGLSRDDIDWENRSVVPNHFSRTKRSGLAFYNEETKCWLERYLNERNDGESQLFIVSDRKYSDIWDKASDSAGIRITAKVLRLWHSVELGEKGTPDRFTDIFQGRSPRSTLAKHYTSRGIERLKAVYDKADLTILS